MPQCTSPRPRASGRRCNKRPLWEKNIPCSFGSAWDILLHKNFMHRHLRIFAVRYAYVELYAIRQSSGRQTELRQLSTKVLATFSSMALSPPSRDRSPYWLEVV